MSTTFTPGTDTFAMDKVALILIVKATDDEAEHLHRCLESVAKHVDGVFLNINHKKGTEPSKKVIDIAKKYANTYIVTEWQDDFAKARNENLAMVPKDYNWVLWLDVDDTIDKPEKIKKVCSLSSRFDSIFVDYLYDRDEHQNPLTVHLVARMFKNNGSHQWKGRIHETLIETRGVTQGATKDFMVIHHAEPDRTVRSFKRNIRLLEKQLKDEADDPDPRTFYYLASTYMDAGDYATAKQLFADYITVSGWDQERSIAHTKWGTILLEEGDTTGAKEHFMLAIGEDPQNPEPRVEMGSLEVELGRYDKAITWLEYVETMEKNLTTLERNPMFYTFRTYLLLAECYLNLGGKYLEKAVLYAKKALKYKKEDKQVRQYVKMIQNVAADRELLVKYLEVYRALKKEKAEDKLDLLLKAVPKSLEDNQIIIKLRDKEPYEWPQKSVVIMTGDTMLDAWGPWSLEEGIGGSEEAIIRISRQLTKLGYKVVVYAKPGHRAGLDEHGVMWRNFWEWNPEDTFDIFVAWRAPFIFEKPIKARKTYLWLHDVMEPGEFTDNRLANIHKVIVLSQYHRSLFPMIPDEQILLSGNGIDPEEFDGIEPERDPHRMIYASSHVRGLVYLYKIWPEVKKAVPDATLHVFYGRESYDKVHKGNPERMKWMDDMILQAKELDGVTDHGKVSQERIVEETFKSGVWPYPCPFPEIYCITAVKAQAGGAVPVSSDFAALNEVVQFGVKLPMKERKEGENVGDVEDEFLEPYKQALIDMLLDVKKQNAIREEMMKWARTLSWESTAKGWDEDFRA